MIAGRYPFGLPVSPKSDEPKPTTLPVTSCGSCQDLSRRYQLVVEDRKKVTAQRDALAEQVTDLEAALRQVPPTVRDVEELRSRLHLTARQEAEQRKRADALEGDVARLVRTVDNLHVRLRGLGVNP